MPGFGSDPFGGGPFGEFDWEKEVLFNLIPELYRLEDLNNNQSLETFAVAEAGLFNGLRLSIRDFEQLRDPLRARTRHNQVFTLRLGERVSFSAAVEQSAKTGEITGALKFHSERARFTEADVGKLLTVEGSSVVANNRTVKVSSFENATTVGTDPLLSVDPGPLRWTLREQLATDQDEQVVRVRGGDVSRVNPGWVLTDGFAEFQVLARQQFPTDETHNLQTLREGTDGQINVSGNLVSSAAVFTARDVGLRVTLQGSVVPENNSKFEIVDVLSASEAVLDVALTFDATPLQWAILRPAELRLKGSSVLRGVAEQFGENGVTSGAAFTSITGQFTSNDEGKILTVFKIGSASNGDYEITTVGSATSLTVTPAFPAASTNFSWTIRAATQVGDTTQVEVRASDLLQYLAQDFGLLVDTRDTEEAQRRFVASVPRWKHIKGSHDAYEYLGILTDFEVTTAKLYRVTLAVANTLPTNASYIIVGEAEAGRSGTDGSVVQSGSVVFSSPTAQFVGTDVGRLVEISNSGTAPTNDGLYEIATVLSSTSVEFETGVLLPTSPETNNGDLVWRIVRLYTEQVPLLPVIDEINVELMTEIKGPAAFSMDLYCTDPNFSTQVGDLAGQGLFDIVSVTPATAFTVPVTYTVRVNGHGDLVQGVGAGKWKITDSALEDFFVEAPPTHVVVTTLTNAVLTAGSPATLTDASAPFTPSYVGQRFRVANSVLGNDSYIFEVDTYISTTTVELIPSDAPSTETGLTIEFLEFDFQVISTSPPATGPATIEYLCPVISSTCGYCESNKVYLTAVTDQVLEQPFERLLDRLNQVKPQHVEFVLSLGQQGQGNVVLTAGGTATVI